MLFFGLYLYKVTAKCVTGCLKYLLKMFPVIRLLVGSHFSRVPGRLVECSDQLPGVEFLSCHITSYYNSVGSDSKQYTLDPPSHSHLCLSELHRGGCMSPPLFVVILSFGLLCTFLIATENPKWGRLVIVCLCAHGRHEKQKFRNKKDIKCILYT